jgi:hypothetical protein
MFATFALLAARWSMAASTKGPPPGGYGLDDTYGFGASPDPAPDSIFAQELASMKERIDRLQKLHLTLFLVSLGLLVASWAITMPLIGHITWAITLGGSVIARVKRQSLVSRYNELVSRGRPAPIT